MLDSQKHTLPKSAADVTLSVVVAAEGDGEGLAELLAQYREALDADGAQYEFILVFDQRFETLRKVAADLSASWPNFVSFPQHPWAGEDVALKLGVERAVGNVFVTLPSWPEVIPSSISKLIDALDEVDLATGKRVNLKHNALQKIRTAATHKIVRLLFSQRFDDVFCRARAGRREVFLASAELGVRQHFLPVIAATEGYTVREVEVPVDERPEAASVYKFKPNAHVGALVDLLTLFVALKFLKRPLRFFGAIGVPLIALGCILTAYLGLERLIFGTPLADRPALVFSIMTLVLGVQVLAIGLVGEIIIFSTTRRIRSYEIDKIIRGMPDDGTSLAAPPPPDCGRPPGQDEPKP